MKVSDLLLSTLSTVAQLGYAKLDPAGRDLEQAKLAIDSLTALVPVLEGSVPEEVLRDFNRGHRESAARLRESGRREAGRRAKSRPRAPRQPEEPRQAPARARSSRRRGLRPLAQELPRLPAADPQRFGTRMSPSLGPSGRGSRGTGRTGAPRVGELEPNRLREQLAGVSCRRRRRCHRSALQLDLVPALGCRHAELDLRIPSRRPLNGIRLPPVTMAPRTSNGAATCTCSGVFLPRSTTLRPSGRRSL